MSSFYGAGGRKLPAEAWRIRHIPEDHTWHEWGLAASHQNSQPRPPLALGTVRVGSQVDGPSLRRRLIGLGLKSTMFCQIHRDRQLRSEFLAVGQPSTRKRNSCNSYLCASTGRSLPASLCFRKGSRQDGHPRVVVKGVVQSGPVLTTPFLSVLLETPCGRRGR